MAKKNTDAIRQKICNQLAQGQSLREICADRAMPAIATVHNWLMPGHPSYNPEFFDQYRVARMWQAESYAEKIIELSRDPNLPPETKKIQIDALKIVIAKLEGRKYGDDKPSQITVKVVYESKGPDLQTPS